MVQLKDVRAQAFILLVLVGLTAYLIFPQKFQLNIFNNLSQIKDNSDATEPTQEFAQKIADICSSKADKYTCYQEELARLAKDKDLFYAKKALNDLQNIDPFTRSCHVLAHRIAEAGTRKDPTKWKDLVNQVDAVSCGGGFLHGVLEAHAFSEPNFKVNVESINELCKKGSFGRRDMCAHFLAHILVLQNDGNIEASLPACSEVANDLQFQCFDGIFMEKHQKNIMVDHQLTKPPTFNREYVSLQKKDCNLYEGIMAAACWTEMAEIFAKAYQYQQGEIYSNCYSAPNLDLARRCYLKGVVVLTTYPGFDTAVNLQSICKPFEGKREEYETCLYFMVSALMNYSVNFTETAIKLCSNVEEVYKERCFKDLGNLLKILAKSVTEREKLCQDSPDTYKNYCEGT